MIDYEAKARDEEAQTPEQIRRRELSDARNWLLANNLPLDRAEFLANYVWRKTDRAATEARKEALMDASAAMFMLSGALHRMTPTEIGEHLLALAGRKEER